ncbi:MAG: glycosyltransferase family 4 protein [Thermodesulfobacteriota bacterium]
MSLHAPSITCGRAMCGLGQARLFLFLSLGASLADWQRGGILERETAIYRALLAHLAGVEVVSYGWRDRAIAAGLGGIKVRQRWPHLHLGLYRRLLERGLHLRGRGPAVVKSNQMQGALTALRAARSAGFPFIARCGYLPSNIALWLNGEDHPDTQYWYRYEAQVFSGADRVAVTTPAMASTVVNRYGIDPGRVRVVPNCVDTVRFRPDGPEERSPGLVLYVGRLHREKNLANLVLAMEGLAAELVLAGEGPQRAELEALAGRRGLAVRFLGQVANAELPGLMRRAAVFVLPSLGEHHPKALIEAMACGAAVVGSDAYGIRELIDHGHNGLLAAGDPASLHAALAAALGDADLRARLGAAARAYVCERFAFDRVLSLELDLIAELVG